MGIQSQNYVDLIFCTRECTLYRPLTAFNKHGIPGQNYVTSVQGDAMSTELTVVHLILTVGRGTHLYLFCSSLPSSHDIEKLNQWNEADPQIGRPLQIHQCCLSVATLLVRCCRNNDNGLAFSFLLVMDSLCPKMSY